MAINRIAETVQQIATATAEQARGSEQIMKSAEKMKAITKHVERSARSRRAAPSRSPGPSRTSARWSHHLNRAQKEQTKGSEQVMTRGGADQAGGRGADHSVRELEAAIGDLGQPGRGAARRGAAVQDLRRGVRPAGRQASAPADRGLEAQNCGLRPSPPVRAMHLGERQQVAPLGRRQRDDREPALPEQHRSLRRRLQLQLPPADRRRAAARGRARPRNQRRRRRRGRGRPSLTTSATPDRALLARVVDDRPVARASWRAGCAAPGGS